MKLADFARKLNASVSEGAFSVSFDKDALEALGVVDEWQDRRKALMRVAPYLAAKFTYSGVLSRIPKGRAYSTYRQSMRLAGVGNPNSGAYIVYARPGRAKNRDVDGSKELVYIRPRKSQLKPPSKVVAVLAKYSPWTMSTLPMTPSPKDAVVIARRASAREIKSIEKQRHKDQPLWRKALSEAGAQVPVQKVTTKVETKVISDVAFAGMRMEFGYGGGKRLPHWRPSIREAALRVADLLAKDPQYSAAFSSPSVNWKGWASSVSSRLSASDLSKFAKFQRRVGVRL